jgi:23S rRNA pseudouridine1911/1915/1917 synthase
MGNRVRRIIQIGQKEALMAQEFYDDENQELVRTAGDEEHGRRLDQVLASLYSDYSRSKIKKWIEEGRVTLDGRVCTVPRTLVESGIEIGLTPELTDDYLAEPQDIPFETVYEDKDIIIINKPAGIVVHPGAGVHDGTLMNGILFRYPENAHLPRAGIVHRLDRDTSGLMVVARSEKAQNKLVKAISKHEVVREYEAVVVGVLTAGGTVDAPIGRSRTVRTMMAVVPEGMGREAVTHYRVLERFRAHTRIRVRLETGRTHQIRVHMAHINHPLVGDPLYGLRRKRYIKGADEEFNRKVTGFPRQALHAAKLMFIHPSTGLEVSFESPIPDDLNELYAVLRRDLSEHPGEYVYD